MDLLIILTYTGICIAIFKIFRIPLNKWSIPTAVLGGIFVIGALMLLMNYNHPYSEVARQYFPTIPIIPQVRGRVVEIGVEPNTPIKEGAILFRLDDTPFQDKVDALLARLEGSQDQLVNLKRELDRSLGLQKKGAGSEREAQSWRLKYDNAVADVDDLKAQLEQARFDLESTVVRAPSDGMVTQLAVRRGMMAGRAAFRPVMLFLPTEESRLVGWFRQNSLRRLKPGSEAEVAFDAAPGEVFSGTVVQVYPVIAEGQVQPTGDLVSYPGVGHPGRVPVIIEIDDPDFPKGEFPDGLYGQAAVYSEHVHHVAIMRRILLRMASWMNYLYPFH